MGGFALPCWIPPGVVQRIGPTVGAYEGPCSVEAVTRRLGPTSGDRDSWVPRGMAQCVWLLTFEHPSDLHPVYMRFGARTRCERAVAGLVMPTLFAVLGKFQFHQTLRPPHHPFEP